MKYIITNILLVVLLVLTNNKLFAQVPQKLSYQAVIRDMDNNLVVNSPVGIRISILQATFDGEAVYSETHLVNTNSNGLVTLEIGTGSVEYGQFDTIKWAGESYFLKSEVDPGGGFNYSVNGTHELLSVPYALHAATADSIAGLHNLIDSLVQKNPSVNISTIDIQNWNLKADSVTGAEQVFDGWDKNAADDFSGNYNDLKNAPKNLSDFNNDKKYLTAEKDPDFNNSVAAAITNDDINRWDTNSTETDPFYSNSVAAGITSADTTLWNANATESDPVFTAWNKSTGISITQSQISDLSFDVFEKELTDGENNIDVGFTLESTSIVFINGSALPSGKWSGVGTQLLNLGISTKQYDKIKIKK